MVNKPTLSGAHSINQPFMKDSTFIKYDIGSVSACNEFGSCHSIITSKKLNKLKIQLFLEP